MVVEAIHLDQLREHGGLAGLRDEGQLEAALARPLNKRAYASRADVALLAAAYAYGIARNHPFRDGNKRVAFLTAAVFLELNGWTLTAVDADVVDVIVKVASGEVTEGALAAWIRERLVRWPRS